MKNCGTPLEEVELDLLSTKNNTPHIWTGVFDSNMFSYNEINFLKKNFQPNRQAKLNWVKHSKEEREKMGGEGDPQYATKYCCSPKAQMRGMTFHYEMDPWCCCVLDAFPLIITCQVYQA